VRRCSGKLIAVKSRSRTAVEDRATSCRLSRIRPLTVSKRLFDSKQQLEEGHSPSHPPKFLLVSHCSSFLSLIENPVVPCPAFISTGLHAKTERQPVSPIYHQIMDKREPKMDGWMTYLRNPAADESPSPTGNPSPDQTAVWCRSDIPDWPGFYLPAGPHRRARRRRGSQ
jgi:hypothetical protein